MTNPTYTLVNVDNLLTTHHHGTQRMEGVRMRRASKMAAEWDDQKVGTITVSRRPDGTLFVLDGAHRVTAAREVGRAQLPALVHDGLTRQQEADMFNGLNTFLAPSAISRFLARVDMGEEDATDIKRIIESHGWKVEQVKRNGNLSAVTAAERVYRTASGVLPNGQHPEVLDWTLSIITSAWEHDKDGTTGAVMEGLAQLHARFGADVDSKKLVSEMAQTRPKILLGKAGALKDARNGTVPAHLAAVLVGLHNHGKRTRLLPEWIWTR